MNRKISKAMGEVRRKESEAFIEVTKKFCTVLVEVSRKVRKYFLELKITRNCNKVNKKLHKASKT